MTVTVNTIYPPEATNAAWQKKKSFLDKTKAKTKTGLGQELTDLQTHWAAVKFVKLDAVKAGLTSSSNVRQVEDKKGLAEDEFKKIKPLIDELNTTAKKAEAVALTKGLSKDAVAAAKVIAARLKTAGTQLGQIDLKDFEQMLTRAEKHEADVDKLLNESIAELKKALNELRNNPTRARWEQQDVQSIDMIRRIVTKDDRFAKAAPKWKDLRADMHMDIPELRMTGAKIDKDKEKQAIMQLVQRVSGALSAF